MEKSRNDTEFTSDNPVYPFGRGREDFLERKSRYHYELLGFDVKFNGSQWDVTNEDGNYVACGDTAEKAFEALERVLYNANNDTTYSHPL